MYVTYVQRGKGKTTVWMTESAEAESQHQSLPLEPRSKSVALVRL
jgi:hypothetical protein